MSGFLFDKIVFGPIYSRRMGSSLGVNLLSLQHKCCSFNCIYCECGWTHNDPSHGERFPSVAEVSAALEEKLIALSEANQPPDAITFAGNGEPTLHPDFDRVIDETINLRDLYAPKSLIAVLSNGTMLHRESVFTALTKTDMNIQKLDAGSAAMIRRINQPNPSFNLDRLIENLIRFRGKVILQTLFLRGTYHGDIIDNTTDAEIDQWIEYLKQIKPEVVMLYPIDRATPATGLEKIGLDELEKIAVKVNALGITTRIYP